MTAQEKNQIIELIKAGEKLPNWLPVQEAVSSGLWQ